MCANFISLRQVMFVIDVTGTKPIVIIYVDKMLDSLLEADTNA